MLENVSTRDLFDELSKRKDGRAYIECVVAGLKMQQCAKSAQEKAGQKILDHMEEYFKEQANFYKERSGENWWEAMKQDNIEYGAMEDDTLAPLVFDFMSLSVG